MFAGKTQDQMAVGLAQIAPVLLNREATLTKVVQRVEESAARGCRLVCFGEAHVPGHPIWLDRADGARFESPTQKVLHALCLDQAVQLEPGHLDGLRRASRRGAIAVVLGTIERAADRGGHSLYCSCVSIAPDGTIGSVHRKLMPTHEERPAWGLGDGAGLVVHRLGAFSVGALNCWENRMPLARNALHVAGEDLHVATWPGSRRNTEDSTRFIARESRSHVLSVSGLITESDVPADVPSRELIAPRPGEVICDGGCAAAAPDGSWVIEPVTSVETLEVITIDHALVRRERQDFDPSGHYARPDVFRLSVNRERQGIVEWP